jgi:hypothetical protein
MRERRHALQLKEGKRVSPRLGKELPLYDRPGYPKTQQLLCNRERIGKPCTGVLGMLVVEASRSGLRSGTIVPPEGRVYYGYADTGYELTSPPRERPAQQAARRPTGGDLTNPDAFMRFGQPLEAPCDIWCSQCGTLHRVEPLALPAEARSAP